jgi:uncharacterized protein
MGLIRLLVLAALIWLVWRVAKHAIARIQQAPRPPLDSQKMVRCAWCDLHIPQTDAIGFRELHFCCDDHRQQWQEKNAP